MTRPIRWRGWRAAAGVLSTVVLTAAVCVLPATPASASACGSADSGVTVVVDFGSLGGGVQIGCAGGDPSDGVVALRGAGFSVAGTTRWGDAFVCRINGKPTTDTEPCADTPPVSAYWSYWHARPGGSWTYSQLGGRAFDPAPGSVDGWSFGGGTEPRGGPPALPAPPPPPPPPAATTQPANSGSGANGGTNGGGANGGGTNGGGANGGGAGATDGAVATASAPTADVTPSGRSTASSSAGSTRPPATSIAVPASDKGSSPLGTLIGLAVVVMLAALGGVTAWRRRTAGRSATTPVDDAGPGTDGG